MRHNGHHGHNGHNGHNGWRGHLAGNGHPGGHGSARSLHGGCPKCDGCVLDRYDLYVGWEAYCVNCGWTPLTVLDAHVIPDAEVRALSELRRWGQRWVSFTGPTRKQPGGR